VSPDSEQDEFAKQQASNTDELASAEEAAEAVVMGGGKREIMMTRWPCNSDAMQGSRSITTKVRSLVLSKTRRSLPLSVHCMLSAEVSEERACGRLSATGSTASVWAW
jgi:hypothetical protein